IEFRDLALGVKLTLAQIGAAQRLVAALAGDPSSAPFERALKRRDFADSAAEFALRDAFVEAVLAVRRDVGRDFGFVRAIDFELEAVTHFHFVDQRNSLLV